MTSITPVLPSLRTTPAINRASGGEPLISIILPARNEGVGVVEAIGAVDEVLGQLGLPYEIIVGDSASQDGTGERVRALALCHVSVVRAEVPGKGRVLGRAMAAARGEIIGFLDSDLEIDPDYLRPAIQAVLTGADAAIGSKVNGAPDSRSIARHAITIGANLLIRTALDTRIADHQAGMKVFRRDVLHAALPHVRATGWLWDTELLARMSARGSSIREIPVRVRPARASGFGSMRQLASAAFELLQVCARLRGNRRRSSLSATGEVSPLAPAK
jgi:glycosyltransferase involved in cell wall biosynthesis